MSTRQSSPTEVSKKTAPEDSSHVTWFGTGDFSVLSEIARAARDHEIIVHGGKLPNLPPPRQMSAHLAVGKLIN